MDFDNFGGGGGGNGGSHKGAGDGTGSDGEEGSEGGGGGSDVAAGRHRPVTGRDLLQVDLEVLERGLREVVPFLCAYLRGHSEVRKRRRADGRTLRLCGPLSFYLEVLAVCLVYAPSVRLGQT